MNTRPPIEAPPTSLVLWAGFNDDYSCFSVGLENGMAIFHTQTCALRVHREFNGGIGRTHMMGRTNLQALVGGGRNPKFPQNKVMIWDDRQAKVVMEISALSPVLGVKMNRDRVFVVLHRSVRVYRLARPAEFMTAYETADNPLGLCALSDCCVAIPGRQIGHVQVISLSSDIVTIITAHNTALRALSLSLGGELVATGSEAGTLIRVFATKTGGRVAELRRGVDSARIFSVAFSPGLGMIACTSDKGNLHVFDLRTGHSSRPSSSSQSTHPSSSPRSSGGGQTAASPTSNSVEDDFSLHSGPAPSTISDGTDQWPSGLSGAAGGGGGGGGNSGSGNGGSGSSSRWGVLGSLARMPGMPRFLGDDYSFAKAPFHSHEPEPEVGASGILVDPSNLDARSPPKGVIGWLNDATLVVIGGGRDARWERFVVGTDSEGRRFCRFDGWRRYVSNF